MAKHAKADQHRLRKPRWQLSDEERARAKAALERPFGLSDLAAAIFKRPALLGLILRSAASGAVNGVKNAPGLVWILQANRLRPIAPDAALGAFWPWQAVEDFVDVARPYLGKDLHALELGAGTGRVSMLLAPELGHLAVSDISPLLLDEARRNLANLDNVSFVKTTGFTLPQFEDGSFDLILSHGVFAQFDANQALSLLGEARRILRPAGACVISWYTIDRPEWAKTHFERTVRVWANSGHASQSYVLAYTESLITALYRAAGFEIAEKRYGRAERPSEPQLYVVVGKASGNPPAAT